MMPFQNLYHGKTVVVTGHTGFKGSWLSLWLKELGAKVIGISIDIPTNPSHFHLTNLENEIQHELMDIRNNNQIGKLISSISPDFIFHLAAQPLVNESYSNPVDTVSTNVLGVSNIMDSIRHLNKKCIGVIITSDKCYDNIEIERGYRENDTLGGKDPYSASKGAAELIFKGYFHSYFKNQSIKRVATARAGNVIGGGDWAENRIVPDCIRAWESDNYVNLRNPHSTRPWQHVLEPLSGYLQLGYSLWTNDKYNGESYNFGPAEGENYSVLELIEKLSETYFNNSNKSYTIANENTFYEASLLSLNCEKANEQLSWSQVLSFSEACQYTGEWYKHYKSSNCLELSKSQIQSFIECSRNKKAKWAS